MKKIIYILALIVLFGTSQFSQSKDLNIKIMHTQEKYKLATFGGGCYWCTEAIFLRVEGVEDIVSGFSGGKVANPTYKDVCSGITGHAEVIQLRYNPDKVTYTELLEIFFKTHDPTSLNRQGADVGTQYRSAIFYHSEAQKVKAEEVILALDKENIWDKPIVTEITAFDIFYPAEASHQDYFDNNKNQGYCRMVIQPKVEKFEKLFKEKLK